MEKKVLLCCGLLFYFCITQAQGLIKTVECYPVGQPFAEPIIELGSGQQLMFSFDDLSGEQNTYTYKIVHCDPDGKPSGLSPFNYLNGFFSNPLDDYAYSYNTGTEYVRFSLLLPNEEVSMKLSGNYMLQVFSDAWPDSAVISQPFSVLEPKVGIAVAVVHAADPKWLYTSQQVNFTVTYDQLPVYNPIKDLKVYVTQNQDPHSRRDFQPTFVRQNQLVYGNGVDNLFNGLSPFRNFQSSSLVYYTQYVSDVLKGPGGQYNFILQPGTVPRRYVSLPDQDGNFYIAAENVQHPNLEADYVRVHFAMLYPEPLPEAEVYIYGKFAGWKLLPGLKMEYDTKHKAYVGEAVLKQGYYDYMYALVPKSGEDVNLVTMQNNFYQTPNEYQVRVYLYDYNLMCYRFVGYQTVKGGG